MDQAELAEKGGQLKQAELAEKGGYVKKWEQRTKGCFSWILMIYPATFFSVLRPYLLVSPLYETRYVTGIVVTKVHSSLLRDEVCRGLDACVFKYYYFCECGRDPEMPIYWLLVTLGVISTLLCWTALWCIVALVMFKIPARHRYNLQCTHSFSLVFAGTMTGVTPIPIIARFGMEKLLWGTYCSLLVGVVLVVVGMISILHTDVKRDIDQSEYHRFDNKQASGNMESKQATDLSKYHRFDNKQASGKMDSKQASHDLESKQAKTKDIHSLENVVFTY